MSDSFPTPGTIVSSRDRAWVVLPSENDQIIRLRPLSGNEDQICGIYRPLLEQNLESLSPAHFPAPDPVSVQDHKAGKLLMNAARLSLRSGAGPFRCLGRLSVRPHPYQIVPLLMALKLDRVRLLIADDVGIGKTIEAGLITRELYDRAEIRRFAVLCPPQLCDQWQKELKQKFNLDAVVIRSGTASKLERSLPSGDHHIFSYYRHLIISLDYVKSERRRASFLTHHPELVIVDEAHTCTQRSDYSATQQRHRLVRDLADNENLHLILLTATPHSGIETAFRSLLGLIKPEFENFDLEHLSEAERSHLAQHFIQRRRADVQDWIIETPFPERESLEAPYRLSTEYRKLFTAVYDFARGLVKGDNSQLTTAQQRGRYWSALAIIRCVMSSPAAAVATLKRQASKESGVGNSPDMLDEDVAASYTYDPTDQEQAVDAPPTIVVEQGKQSYQEKERRQLREFVRQAEQLQGKADPKLQRLSNTIQDLLSQGNQPIIWCRYITTANYLTEQLRQQFTEKKNKSELRIIGITGELSEDEREIRLQELITYPKRVLVATDCLSEGINLQLYFNAVIHYDLPWNPNRLEQREGRIDRYGQTAKTVPCYLLYGQDNPVDGAVLDVLIRKAVTIHNTLGITVPVPLDSNDVSEAVFQSLFEHAEEAQQLSLLELLDDQDTALLEVQKSWDRAVEREKVNRSRFAQRTIKPEQVQTELEDSDRALGSSSQVEEFVKTALERLNTSLIKKRDYWRLPNIPACLIPVLGDQPREITFTSPAPEGIDVIGRNHPLVETLAKTLLEEALENPETSVAARCGFTVTDAIDKPVFILLLRGRYLIKQRKTSPLLAEECWLQGFTGIPSQAQWLTPEETETLFDEAQPVADYPLQRKQDTLTHIIDRLEELTPSLEQFARDRAENIAQSHQRVRSITKEGKVNVEPQLPLDILGVYILQPK